MRFGIQSVVSQVFRIIVNVIVYIGKSTVLFTEYQNNDLQISELAKALKVYLFYACCLTIDIIYK